ncbi:MAG: hypothetical protein AAF192_00270 [Pseudomonadota bacterium]
MTRITKPERRPSFPDPRFENLASMRRWHARRARATEAATMLGLAAGGIAMGAALLLIVLSVGGA